MGNMETVTAVLNGIALYLSAGAVIAMLFLLFAAPRLDNATKQSSIAFRLLIFPGLVALWPLIILRWLSGGQPHGD